jgi:hypothetical protein
MFRRMKSNNVALQLGVKRIAKTSVDQEELGFLSISKGNAARFITAVQNGRIRDVNRYGLCKLTDQKGRNDP